MTEDACSFCGEPVAISAKHCPNCGQPHVLRDKYRIVGLLGRGGFGIVYEAADMHLKRRYAIKVILSDSAAGQQQVLTEAEILAQHARRLPFMPEIYDIWHEGPRTTLVMEFVEGQTLGQLLGDGTPWAVGDVADFLRTVLVDLARLHAVGIIHRDLKPDNIKRTPDGRYMLLDFGIAKLDGSTLAGAKAFSPAYASPEQMRGLPTDARSDLYSLGATAYHLLTGQAPVPSEYRRSANITLPAPSDIVVEKIPPVLQTIILKMLSLDADERPTDANAALAMLEADVAASPAEPVEPGQVVARTTVMLQETASRVAEIKQAAEAMALHQAAESISESWREGGRPRGEHRFHPALLIGLAALVALVAAGATWWFVGRAPAATGPVGDQAATATLPAEQAATPVFDQAGAARAAELTSFGRGRIEGIAFAPDGGLLAVATSLGVELWDTKNWQQTGALTGFVRPVRSLAWNSSGILATINGGEVRLWNADGAMRAALPGQAGSSLDRVEWSPDGQRLVAIDFNAVLVWNDAGDLLARHEIRQVNITQMAWSPDSQRFATGSYDGHLRIWSRDGEEIAALASLESADPDQLNWIEALAWSPDGATLAAGNYVGRIGLWQAADGSFGDLPDGHTDSVVGLAWSPDGATLASSARDSTLRFWRDGQPARTINGQAAVSILRWDAAGEGFVAASIDGFLRLWSVDGLELRAYQTGSGQIRGMTQTADGQLLAAFTESEIVHVWRRDGSQAAQLEGYTPAVQGLAPSPDGATVAIDSWAWDVALWKPFDPEVKLLRGHSNSISAVAWSPDGATVAAAAQDLLTRLWRADGPLVKTLEAKGVTLALAWSRDNVLAGGGSDGVVRLWNASGGLVKELSGGLGAVTALAWSLDGQRLAVGAENGALVVWDAAGARVELKGHREPVIALAWSPDGQRLVSGSWDDTARVWGADGDEIATLTSEGSGDIKAVAWSADGARIAVGAQSGELRLWSADGELINVVQQHTGDINAARWNSHGILATASSDRTIRLWSAEGSLLATLTGHTEAVNALAWAADDTRLYTAGEDGTVRLWGVRPQQ